MSIKVKRSRLALAFKHRRSFLFGSSPSGVAPREVVHVDDRPDNTLVPSNADVEVAPEDLGDAPDLFEESPQELRASRES